MIPPPKKKLEGGQTSLMKKDAIHWIDKKNGITLKRVSGPTLHKYDLGIYYHICVGLLCITNKKCGYSRMVKFLFAKEKMRVRFPLSAPDQVTF
jgi:hypothetical protein